MAILRIIDDKNNKLEASKFGKSFKSVLNRPLVGETLIYKDKDKGIEKEYIVKKVINGTEDDEHTFTYILYDSFGEL